MRRDSHISAIVCAAAMAAITLLAAVEAKLISLTLAEMLARSDVVVRAQRTAGEVESSGGGRATLSNVEFLYPLARRGGDRLIVCNDDEDRTGETTDVRALRPDAIYFLKYQRGCYRPAHGYLSVYDVTQGYLDTAFMLNQPPSQTVAAFKRAVRQIVDKPR